MAVRILVVGVGNSGAEIAYELGETRRTLLAGTAKGEIPVPHGSRRSRMAFRAIRFFAHHVLRTDTRIGRKVGPKAAAKGPPLIRRKEADFAAVDIQHRAENDWHTDFSLRLGVERDGVIDPGDAGERIYKVLVPEHAVIGDVADADGIPVAYLPIVRGYRRIGEQEVVPLESSSLQVYPMISLLLHYRTVEATGETEDVTVAHDNQRVTITAEKLTATHETESPLSRSAHEASTAKRGAVFRRGPGPRRSPSPKASTRRCRVSTWNATAKEANSRPKSPAARCRWSKASAMQQICRQIRISASPPTARSCMQWARTF